MSDVQWLFLILALLYVWECACWLKSGSVVFTTWLGKRWMLKHPGTLLGNDKGGFIFAQPLPPLGRLLLASQIPISISPDGVFSFVSTNVNKGPRTAQGAQFFKFDDIRDVKQRGKKVVINGDVFLKTASSVFAESIAGQIRELTKVPREHRNALIASMYKQSLDTEAIVRRWKEFQGLARWLRVFANALVVFVFVIAPVVVWVFGFRLSWLALLIALLCLTTCTAVLFRRAHKKLYPTAEEDRFTQTFTALLSPASAMRAHDTLSRPLLESFHPLAVAKVFLAEKPFRSYAGRILRDVQHPALPVDGGFGGPQGEVEAFSRSALLEAMEEFLKREGVSLEELCRPPVRVEESCCAYCPRCEAQFTTVDGVCVECGGLRAVRFSEPPMNTN
jgi:hypothetical protein